MSSGKNVASILMAMMVQEGHLKYDEYVYTYWPEFVQNGKGMIKVEDVLRHEAGLHRLHKIVEPINLRTK